jgi:hypothetical protein
MTTFMAIGEVAAWLKDRGLLGPKRVPLLEEVDYSKLCEVRWLNFGHQIQEFLADILAGFFKEEDEVLLCIDDWAMLLDENEQVFDAAGLNIFYRFRQALGDPAMVWDKPGHLFRGDQLDMQSLLRLVLALQWDVYVVSASGNVVARVYDSDICSLYAADPGLLDAELLERLDKRLKKASSSVSRLVQTSTSPDGKWLIEVYEHDSERPGTTHHVKARRAGGGDIKFILYIDSKTQSLQWASDGKHFLIEWESPDTVLVGGLRAQVPASGK